jgi:hypothetical protein
MSSWSDGYQGWRRHRSDGDGDLPARFSGLEVAHGLGITERRAHGIVTDLAEAGYVIKKKDGRRNLYQVQAHLPVPGPGTREPAIGEIAALFAARGRPLPDPGRASERDASGSRQACTP